MVVAAAIWYMYCILYVCSRYTSKYMWYHQQNGYKIRSGKITWKTVHVEISVNIIHSFNSECKEQWIYINHRLTTEWWIMRISVDCIHNSAAKRWALVVKIYMEREREWHIGNFYYFSSGVYYRLAFVYVYLIIGGQCVYKVERVCS